MMGEGTERLYDQASDSIRRRHDWTAKGISNRPMNKFSGSQVLSRIEPSQQLKRYCMPSVMASTTLVGEVDRARWLLQVSRWIAR